MKSVDEDATLTVAPQQRITLSHLHKIFYQENSSQNENTLNNMADTQT